MLILSRRKNESIIINENIRVICLGISQKGHFKFGIEAPSEISIHREEIYNKILSEKKGLEGEERKTLHLKKPQYLEDTDGSIKIAKRPIVIKRTKQSSE